LIRQLPAIGVDLGATKIATALVAPSGEIIASRQVLTAADEGTNAVLSRLALEIDLLADQSPGNIAGVGIGSPGRTDPQNGIIRDAINLGWEEVHLVDGIRDRLKTPLPIWLQKDSNATALGEYYFGAGKGCQDFVFLSIGSGLGGGIIAGGRIFSGGFGQASELGHLSLDPKGRPCVCGLRGCSETVVSGPGLVTVAREQLTVLNDNYGMAIEEELTPSRILNAARGGEQWALAALEDVGAGLGAVLAVCVSALNPTRFVIGGGLGLAAYDFLVPPALEELKRRVPKSLYPGLQIVPACLASSAVGAACLVWQSMEMEVRSLL
jgi:glucokinase